MMSRGTRASYSQVDFWKSKPSNIDHGAKQLPEHLLVHSLDNPLEVGVVPACRRASDWRL